MIANPAVGDRPGGALPPAPARGPRRAERIAELVKDPLTRFLVEVEGTWCLFSEIVAPSLRMPVDPVLATEAAAVGQPGGDATHRHVMASLAQDLVGAPL